MIVRNRKPENLEITLLLENSSKTMKKIFRNHIRINLSHFSWIQVIYKEIQKEYYIDKIQIAVFKKLAQSGTAIRIKILCKILASLILIVIRNKIPNKLIFIIMLAGKPGKDKIFILLSNCTPKLFNVTLITLKPTLTEDSHLIELVKLIELLLTTLMP